MAFISSTTQGRLSLTNWELHTTLPLPPSVTHLAKRDKSSSVGEIYKMGISVMWWFFFIDAPWIQNNIFYPCKQTKKCFFNVIWAELEINRICDNLKKNMFIIKCYTLMIMSFIEDIIMHFRCQLVAYDNIQSWCDLTLLVVVKERKKERRSNPKCETTAESACRGGRQQQQQSQQQGKTMYIWEQRREWCGREWDKERCLWLSSRPKQTPAIMLPKDRF